MRMFNLFFITNFIYFAGCTAINKNALQNENNVSRFPTSLDLSIPYQKLNNRPETLSSRFFCNGVLTTTTIYDVDESGYGIHKISITHTSLPDLTKKIVFEYNSSNTSSYDNLVAINTSHNQAMVNLGGYDRSLLNIICLSKGLIRSKIIRSTSPREIGESSPTSIFFVGDDFYRLRSFDNLIKIFRGKFNESGQYAETLIREHAVSSSMWFVWGYQTGYVIGYSKNKFGDQTRSDWMNLIWVDLTENNLSEHSYPGLSFHNIFRQDPTFNQIFKEENKMNLILKVRTNPNYQSEPDPLLYKFTSDGKFTKLGSGLNMVFAKQQIFLRGSNGLETGLFEKSKSDSKYKLISTNRTFSEIADYSPEYGVLLLNLYFNGDMSTTLTNLDVKSPIPTEIYKYELNVLGDYEISLIPPKNSLGILPSYFLKPKKCPQKLPLLIYLHGGDFMSTPLYGGRFFSNGDDYQLAQLGIPLLALSYSGDRFPEYERIDQTRNYMEKSYFTSELDDVVKAVNGAAQLECVDSSKVFLMGHSNGAMLLANFLTTKKKHSKVSVKIAGAIIKSGYYSDQLEPQSSIIWSPYDFALRGTSVDKVPKPYDKKIDTSITNIEPLPEILGLDRALELLNLQNDSVYGVKYKRNLEYFNRTVPLHRMNQFADTKYLIVQGEKDFPQNAINLNQALKSKGLDSRIIIFRDQGHTFDDKTYQELLPDIAEFLGL